MSPLILVMRHWKYVLIAALLVLLSFSLVGISQKNSEIESIRNQNELEVAALKTKYIETARDMERRHYEQQIRAVNEYKERGCLYFLMPLLLTMLLVGCQTQSPTLAQPPNSMPNLETGILIPQPHTQRVY